LFRNYYRWGNIQDCAIEVKNWKACLRAKRYLLKDAPKSMSVLKEAEDFKQELLGKPDPVWTMRSQPPSLMIPLIQQDDDWLIFEEDSPPSK